MVPFRRRRDVGRPRLSVLRVAPAVGLFTVMAVPWLTTQAYNAQDAHVVPFELAAHQTAGPAAPPDALLRTNPSAR
jgi:hypothetical protein